MPLLFKGGRGAQRSRRCSWRTAAKKTKEEEAKKKGEEEATKKKAAEEATIKEEGAVAAKTKASIWMAITLATF
jgi:hypothetical protein